MKPTELIMTALAFGSTESAKGSLGQAGTYAYKDLISLVRKRFAGNEEAEYALIHHEKKPDIYAKPLEEAIRQVGLQHDNEILDRARALLATGGIVRKRADDADSQFHNIYTFTMDQGLREGQDLETLTRNLSVPPISTPGHVWNIPFTPNPFFTGREEVLKQLEQAFFSTQKVAPTKTQAILGAMDIGKTQVAIEYVYRQRGRYRAIFWAQADTVATLDVEFGKIATLLDLPDKDAPRAEQIREAVKRWLSENADYLLTLDNADAPGILADFLPSQPAGHILLTSRVSPFTNINVRTPIELHAMTHDEAVALLMRRTNRIQVNEAEHMAVSELADELGGMPSLLEQAGAYMAVNQASFGSYLTTYHGRNRAQN